MKNVLIVGANSFIGSAVRNWLMAKYPGRYVVTEIEAKDGKWKNANFAEFDVVFQVAGIAHVPKETPEMEEVFFSVNADMTEDIALAAKAAGVKQYVFMSTKGVYPPFVTYIDENTKTGPVKLYGKSKLAGEQKILPLVSEDFKVAVLRCPSVYGAHAPGSYLQLLKKIDRLCVFPAYKNKRSMIYIDNLCEFIHLVIDRELSGVLVPQDAEYMSTSDIVRVGAKIKGKRILFDYLSWPLIAVLVKLTYKFRKPFGSTVYKRDFSMSDKEYYVCNFEDAVRRTIEEEQL